ncbi:hypothetical protein Tco_0733168, partial [Tanacetum coccineum]
GKSYEKNYSSVRRYIADPDNVFPEQSIIKLILKVAVIFDVKCIGYLVRAYYNISPTRYYKDDSCWSADLKSKTTEDIISIGSFVEVFVLNQYALVRKILCSFRETENPVVQNTSSSAQQDELLISVIKEMSSQVAKCNKVQQENLIVNETLTAELERKVHASYDGHIVKTHDALYVTDTEETLELAEESRLKMLAKQNDPSLKEKKVHIYPVNYVALNKLSEHFVKHFVPQKQLYAEQAYWLPILKPISEKPHVPSEPILKKEIPRELSSISLGVEHIKGAFEKDVKPFAQTLKEYFQLFEHGLYKELKDMKAVFNQMETKVAKYSVDKKYFEIEKKELCLDNDRLLEHVICQDVMNTVMHANNHSDNVLPAKNIK